jgi:hypothetical protein
MFVLLDVRAAHSLHRLTCILAVESEGIMSSRRRMKAAMDHNVIDLHSVARVPHFRLIQRAYDSFVDAQVQVRTASQTRETR